MQTRLFFQKNPFRLLLGGLLALLSLIAQGQLSQLQKLTPQAGERQANSLFGTSVAVDGNVMVVGAYREPGGGAAYVYEKSGGTWNQTARLTASDRAADDQFGYSVSVSGSTIVVGAYSEDEDASGSNTVSTAGSAYVFEKSGGTWSQTQKITASDRAVTARFGYSVSVSGSTLVVGAYGKDEFAGSAYVFEKSGATWSQTQKLTASDRTGFDLFGYSVSVSGSTIVVGAYQEDEDTSGNNPLSNAGSAYIFEKSGATWSQTQKLTASDRANNDYFGISVSVSGSTLVVGAYAEDEDASGNNMLNSAGSAYVFEKSGGTWSQTQKLTAADRATFDSFGYSVSASGSTIVVGAYLEDQDASGNNTVDGAGSAYVFEKSGATWSQTQKLTASDRAALDQFGNSVSVSGSTIVVGAYEEDEDASGNNPLSNAGSAYVFGPSCPVSSIAYVNAAVGSTGNGSGWGTAFKTLQEALTATTTCPGITLIWVAKGTYYPDEGPGQTDNDRNAAFSMKNGVALYGGFAGNEAANYDLSLRNFVTNQTSLSGDIDKNNTLDNGNSYHVVHNNANGLNSTAKLDGFTITNGYSDGVGVDKYGGGMRNSSSSPSLANCTFSGNSVSYGGGMYNENASSMVLTNCTFSGNLASINGGGMFNANSFLTLTNCSFTGNSSGEGGGGMLNYYSSAVVTNCTFSGNSATYLGGGMLNTQSSSLVVTNCKFIGNSAPQGGAMLNSVSSPTITNCSFSGNVATEGGMMFNTFSSFPPVTNCIFWGNSSGIANYQNSAPTITYSIVQGGHAGTGNKNLDPLFVQQPPAGLGTTGDLHLQAGSPAINAGTNTGAPSTDIEGNPRPLTAANPADMGAYEFINLCPTYASNRAYVNGAVAVGTNDGTTWATAFLTLQAALNAASTCGVTEIWVAQGTYYPTADALGNASPSDPRDKTFHLIDGVAIYGGFPDTGNPTLSDRNWRTYPTTLSGEIQQDNDPGNNAYHVVLSAQDGPATRLDGFTLTGGNANGSGSLTIEGKEFNRNRGGGANLMNSSPQLANLLVTGNAASNFGGISANDGSPTLTNVAILNHSTGGMAYITSAIPGLVITMTNVVFAGNSTGIGGGGLQLNGLNMTANLTNVVFANNSASNIGGAIASGGCTINLVNCTFYNNSAGGSGGAIYNANGATVNDKNGIYYNNNNGNTAYNGVFNFPSVTPKPNTFNSTTTLSGTDPKFVNAANPIGPDSFWMTNDDGLALASDSPAINVGTLAGAPTTDIRGLTRTGNPDQGAYEGSCTLPTAFTVTGGGGYCTGGSGVAIGLSGSESGVSYQLKNSANTVVATATGNGSALSFGIFTTAGTYTVVAIRTETCTAPMTGSATVSVNPPPTPSITASGPTTFCAGGSVTLSAGTYSSYVWKNGDTQVSTDPTYVATASGSYTVTVTDGSCSATSSPVVVTVTTPVFTQQPSVPANLTVCANGSVSITFNVNCPGSGSFTAQLSDPNGNFASGTQNLGPVSPVIPNTVTIPGLTAPTSAAYRIRIVGANPTMYSLPTGIFKINALEFNSTPTVNLTAVCAGAVIKVSFTVNGNCPFLPGNAFSVELSDGSGSFASPVVLGSVAPGINTLTVPQSIPTGSAYRVRIRATAPALLSSQSAAFTVNQPGFASTPSVSLDNKCPGEAVRLSFSIGCAFFAGNTFTAQLSNAAGSFATPVNVGTVTAGALNNVVIPAGTPVGTGYKLRVVSSNPVVTSAVSANFKVKACGTNREIAPEATGLRVVVSPNPSPEGRLRIAVTGAEGQSLRVTLFNGLGQSVREQTIERASEAETLTWDILRQPQGLYLLRVSSKKETKTMKVLH